MAAALGGGVGGVGDVRARTSNCISLALGNDREKNPDFAKKSGLFVLMFVEAENFGKF